MDANRRAAELHRSEPASAATSEPSNPCAALLELTGEEREALLLAYYGALTPAEPSPANGAPGASTAGTARAAVVRLARLIAEPPAETCS